jgi:hypothetical protein
VNFVTGTAAGPATGCKNSTGVTMSYTSDDTLDGPYRAANASGTAASGSPSATGSGSGTKTSASASASKSSSARAGYVVPGNSGSFGVVAWMVIVAAATTAFRIL